MFLIKRFMMQVHEYTRFSGQTAVFSFLFTLLWCMTSDTWQDIFMARVQILCFQYFYGKNAFFKMELEVYVSWYSIEISQVLLLI